MAKGFTTVRNAAADIEARKQGANEGGSLWFKIKNSGDSAVVRFLDSGDDVKWAWMHQVPSSDPNQRWGNWVPCRDQDDQGTRIGEPCPGCEREYKRSFQGFINLIWRNAPILQRDDQGKIVRDQQGNPIHAGYQDQLAAWQSGILVFEELDAKDVTYKGLTSRDFRVTRRGTGLNTRYSIEPADVDSGPQPLSDADKELADKKRDFTDRVTPPPYATWGQAANSFNQQAPAQDFAPADVSPFMRTNR